MPEDTKNMKYIKKIKSCINFRVRIIKMKMIALMVWPGKKKNQIQKRNLSEPFINKIYRRKLPKVFILRHRLQYLVPEHRLSGIAFLERPRR